MAREMTPQERAAAIVDKVKSELTPIWLGGRQRMLLEQEIAEAIIATRRAALLEAAQVVREFVQHYPTDIFIEPLPGQHGRTVDACSASAIRAICPTIADAIDRLAQEGA
jgi:hypothetical protein